MNAYTGTGHLKFQTIWDIRNLIFNYSKFSTVFAVPEQVNEKLESLVHVYSPIIVIFNRHQSHLDLEKVYCVYT